MDEKIEKLSQLGALSELLYKCIELIELNGLSGGSDGYALSCVKDAHNEVYREVETLKTEIRNNS